MVFIYFYKKVHKDVVRHRVDIGFNLKFFVILVNVCGLKNYFALTHQYEGPNKRRLANEKVP